MNFVLDASRFLSLLAALPIVVEPPDRRRALDAIPRLARAHRLSSYDATYLDLALRYGLELATRDQVLRAAAEREGVAMRAP
jgi:predicted nucleic acid-binding protein